MISIPISIPEARKMNLVECLIFTPPNELMETRYGRVSAKNWMLAEANRITTCNLKGPNGKNPKRYAALVLNAVGHIALYVDNIAAAN